MIVGSAKEVRKTKAGWAEYMRKYRKARPDIMKKIFGGSDNNTQASPSGTNIVSLP